MKKIVFMAALLLCSCSTGTYEDFGNSNAKLNTWAGRASFNELCDGLSGYKKDRKVVDRILLEFHRRNISYMNCSQYKGTR